MLLFQLIPQFLSVMLYDPEAELTKAVVTHDVRLSTISDIKDGIHYKGSTIWCQMRCHRPTNHKMRCHLVNPKSTLFYQEHFGLDGKEIFSKDLSFVKYGLDADSFEVHFNEHGIMTHYVVEELSIPYVWNTFRMIGNQLNIGLNFRGEKNATNIQGIESFTTGHCQCNLTVKPIIDPRLVTDPAYKLYVDPAMKYFGIKDEALEIHKERDVNSCIPHAKYFFATRRLYDVVPKNTVEKLVASQSHIIVGPYSFSSETTNRVDIYDDVNRTMIAHVIDHVIVRLRTVGIEEEHITPVFNPISVPIVPNTANCSATY